MHLKLKNYVCKHYQSITNKITFYVYFNWGTYYDCILIGSPSVMHEMTLMLNLRQPPFFIKIR